jgi:hypothetical protein
MPVSHRPFAFFALILFAACQQAPPPPPPTAQNPPVFDKKDLQKLRWIEGNWKSEVSGPGFYQTYHFPNDSMLEVVSYQLNETDTSATSITQVYWKDGHFYIGAGGEWVAVQLDQISVKFDPVRDGWNSIHWLQNSKDEFTATHTKPEFVRTIHMRKQPPLQELLAQKKAAATE